LPCGVVEKGVEGIIECWRDKVDRRAISRKRVMELVEAAKRSIGKKEGRKLARQEIKYLLRRLVKNFVFPIYNVSCKVGLCC